MDNKKFESEAKYSIGDKFRKNFTRGYSWLKVIGIKYGVIEPIYTLSIEPMGSGEMEYGEAELDENFHKL